jgi:hypothetical protein
VPFDPLAQTTAWLTELTPRKDAVVPLGCGAHDCAEAINAKKKQSIRCTIVLKVTRNRQIAP